MNSKTYKFLAVVVTIIMASVLVCGCGKQQQEETPTTAPTVYVVTFDSVGGNLIEAQEIEAGLLASKPADPNKEGFTFVEWQFNGFTYDFSTPVTANLTLVAYYTVNEGIETVSVAFNADNGSPVNTVQVAKGTSIAEPDAPQKGGHRFDGWFLNETKFDFSTPINENLVLKAQWTVDPTVPSTTPSTPNQTPGTTEGNGNSQPTEGTTTPSTTPNQTDPTEGTTAPSRIKYSDVAGDWYAEGTDDVILTFSLDSGDTWVCLNSTNFDYLTCEIEMHAGRGGGEYYNDNGYFTSNEIRLLSNSKLTYTKNNKTITFYRQKDYPTATEWEYEKLLKAIDGYYWYLDGYEYTYIHGDVIPWYGHECLSWESENIKITRNSLVAYENYEPEKYREYNSSASSDTHNTLLVNPIEYADSLIDDFGMRVSSNKLYMTVGGQQYTFSRHSQKKAIVPTLTANQTSFAVTEGEWVEVTVTASPWWQYYTFDATSSGAIQGGSTDYGTSNGKVSFSFYATKEGTGSAVIKEKNSGESITISVTVSPTYVEGVSLDQASVELTKGSTATLKATVSPSNASNKKVTWSSSNTSVATVSSSGVVTARSPGTATITVTTNDGGHTASCEVTVKQSPLKVSASIGMEMRFTSDGMQQGVSVNINASGGSESYVAYSIKLYYEGEYVGEVTEKSMFVTPYKNGTYTAEVYVKDSDGNEATSTSTTNMSITTS